MNISVQKTAAGSYGIWLEDDWLKTHFDPINIECEDKSLMDDFASQLRNLGDSLEIINGKITKPQIPLYHLISFYTHVNNGFDLVTDEYDWIISCDPMFHPVPGPEQSAQLRYFDAALEWLDQIGAKYKILPQRFQSKEEIIEEGMLQDYLISNESTNIIFDHWNKLTCKEKASFYYIYLNAEHNFIGSFLALKEVIDPEEFGKMVTASIGVAPEFRGVTEKTFCDGWTHYARIVENVLAVRQGTIK